MVGFQQVKHRLKCQEEELLDRIFLDMAEKNTELAKARHGYTDPT